MLLLAGRRGLHPLEGAVSWLLLVLEEAPCSAAAALCGDGVHGGEVDDPLCRLDPPLQPPPLSQCGVAVALCDGAGEDPFHQSSVGRADGLTTDCGLFHWYRAAQKE